MLHQRWKIKSIHTGGERAPISQDNRESFADWFYHEDVLKHGQAANRSMVESLLGKRGMKRYTKQVVNAMTWADFSPTVTALYGDSECLWMAGFAPDDYPTGRSLTWVGLNVHTGTTRVVRVPRRGARVREFGGGFVYTTYQDDDGLNWLERYPVSCN